ncbi:MAG: hypothetical protein M3Q76_10030 [Acidobacteriota bacterium]|nr:hypothetical protein [Acidobacteriota bacterium]
MQARLWHMNVDFEAELAAPAGRYAGPPATLERLNRKLAPLLLWLARPGDALLYAKPWPETLLTAAANRGVELVDLIKPGDQSGRRFTPWGWTPGAVRVGEQAGAVVRPIPPATVARVNSKLWSHALELELGVAMPGAATADTMEQLREAVSRACPGAQDKWVIKSSFGFAARERVLGRGPALEGAPAVWCERRVAAGETLIFQPWLERLREYGVTMLIERSGEVQIEGVSDLQTNGAGTGTGYLLGRPPTTQRIAQLTEAARIVGRRLFAEGYTGTAGLDALEHAGGLHPLLEINARYTMGFVALAFERALRPQQPVLRTTEQFLAALA